jgi:hypothetical protein
MIISIYLTVSVSIGNTHVKYSRRELLLLLPGGSINEAIAKKTSIHGLYPSTAYRIIHTHDDDEDDGEEVMVDIVVTTSMEGVLEFTMKYAKGCVVRIVCISSQ